LTYQYVSTGGAVSGPLALASGPWQAQMDYLLQRHHRSEDGRTRDNPSDYPHLEFQRRERFLDSRRRRVEIADFPNPCLTPPETALCTTRYPLLNRTRQKFDASHAHDHHCRTRKNTLTRHQLGEQCGRRITQLESIQGFSTLIRDFSLYSNPRANRQKNRANRQKNRANRPRAIFTS